MSLHFFHAQRKPDHVLAIDVVILFEQSEFDVGLGARYDRKIDNVCPGSRRSSMGSDFAMSREVDSLFVAHEVDDRLWKQKFVATGECQDAADRMGISSGPNCPEFITRRRLYLPCEHKPNTRSHSR